MSQSRTGRPRRGRCAVFALGALLSLAAAMASSEDARAADIEVRLGVIVETSETSYVNEGQRYTVRAYLDPSTLGVSLPWGGVVYYRHPGPIYLPFFGWQSVGMVVAGSTGWSLSVLPVWPWVDHLQFVLLGKGGDPNSVAPYFSVIDLARSWAEGTTDAGCYPASSCAVTFGIEFVDVVYPPAH